MSRLLTMLQAAALLCACAAPVWASSWYSQGSLAPELVSSWNSQRDGSGMAPANFAGADTFVVQSGHLPATAAAWTLADPGALLLIEAGGTLTANHLVSVAAFELEDGATYVHNAASAVANGAATDFPGTVRALAPASTVEIRRWANGGTAPVPLPSARWGNLTINVTALGGDWSQGANLDTVSGDLTVLASGASGREFRFTGGGTRTVTILGDYYQGGGYASCSGVAGTITVDIGGDFTLAGGIFSTAEGVSIVSTVHVAGDFSHTGGTLTENGNQGGMIVFDGTGVQTFTGGGVVTQTIGWQVASGATLDLGAYVLAGGGTFTLHAGGGLRIGSPAGISASSAVGNVQTAGLRTFNAGADYTYRGAVAQTTGSGLPANVRDFTLDNPAGVTLTGSLTVNGTLALGDGVLGIGVRTLTLNGPVSALAGSIGSGATGTVLYNAATPGQYVAPGSYGNLTFGNQAKTLAATGTLAVAGAFNPGAATGHEVAGSTIEFNGAGAQVVPAFGYHHLASSGTAPRTLAAGSTIRIAGAFTPGPNPYTLGGSTVVYDGAAPQVLPAGFGSYAGLTVDNPAGVTLGGDVTVAETLHLAQGVVATGSAALTVGPAGAVTRAAGHVDGFLEKSIPAGTSAPQFEIGSATDYLPVALELRGVTVPGALTVSTTAGDHPALDGSGVDSARTVNRFWTLAHDGIEYDEYDLTLSFATDEVDPAADPADFILASYDPPEWTRALPGTLTTNTIQARGLKSFSDFVVGALEIHTLTPSAGPNGSIAPPDPVLLADGASQTFTITPDPHYSILDVRVDGVSVGPVTSYEFVDVDTSHTLEASFELIVHSITASAGPGGAIVPGGVVGVADGADRTFAIAPDPFHHVTDVVVDGLSVGPLAEYTFTNVTGDHTLAASFAIDTYAIVASAGPNGAIDPSGTVVVAYGADTTFTITPDPFHHVLDVRVDSLSVGAVTSYAFTGVAGPHTLEASFAIDTYAIVASAGPNGAIDPSGTVVVAHGADTTFTFTPDPYHHVLDVMVDGVPLGPSASHTFTGVSAPHTIAVTFAIDTYAITAAAGPGGSIAPSGVITVPALGSREFDVAPDPGHYLADVTVDGVSIGKVAQPRFTGVLADHSIVATFARNDSLEALLSFRAAQADSQGPPAVPGAASPWDDLIGDHDATLVSFLGNLASGWKGEGTVASPYRLHFAGEGEVAVVADTVPALQNHDPISAELWFRTGHDGPTPEREYLLEWVESGAGGMSIGLAQGMVQVELGAWTDVAPLPPATWHHLVVAKEPGEARVYLDGARVHTSATPHLGAQTTPIALGASSASFALGVPVHTGFFRGDLAEVTIWRGAMGDAQALAAFETRRDLYLPAPELPPVCAVELRAGRANGEGPYPRPGADSPWVDLSAAPSPVALWNFGGSDSSGWLGVGSPGSPYRLRFDGIDDVATIDPASLPELMAADAVTVELWFDPALEPPAGERRYLLEWVQGFGRKPGLAIAIEAGQVQLELGRSGWIAIGPAPPGEWTHVAVVKAPGEVRAYLDGVLAHGGTLPGFGEPGSGVALGASTWRGAGIHGDFFAGAIAQASIHRGARTAEEVADSYAADAGLYHGVLAAPATPHRLALPGAWPNPTRAGRLTIAFSLPDAGPAALELLDVAGRRLARREVGALGPGRHSMTLAEGARLAPGLYLIRLHHGGRALGAKVMVVR